MQTDIQDRTSYLVDLDERDRDALSHAAMDRGLTPEEWLASVAEATLSGRPRWNSDDCRHLEEISSRLGQIEALLKDMDQDVTVRVLKMLYAGLCDQLARMNERQRDYWR